VRPVLPKDALGLRTGGREDVGREDVGREHVGREDVGWQDAERQHPGREDAGRQDAARLDGAANTPHHRTAREAGSAVHTTDSSRALVPAGPAYQPLSADDGRERIHVPVASAPQLTVALSAAARLVLHAASGGGHGGFAAGATVGSGGSESRGRISPAAATAASDSYRRHGGLPTPGIQSGRIFRVSI
jgi:hypothetical protein